MILRSYRVPHPDGIVALSRRRLIPEVPSVKSAAGSLALLVAISAAAISAGWLTAHGHAIYVALAGAIAASCVLTFTAPAPLAALLVLVILNGVPLADMSHRLPGGLKIQDLAVLGLVGLLLAHPDRAASPARARIIRAAMIWSACFVAWWSYEVARSALLDGIPWLKAALFGRDFLYFALLLPLAVRARFPLRSLRTAGLLLLAGTTACAAGQAVQSLTGIPLTWLSHPHAVDVTPGIGRVYSDMAYVINTALIFAAALFLSKAAKGARWLVGAFVVLFFVDAALQLTRANYLSLAVGLVVAVGFYAMRYGSVTTVVVRAAVVAGILMTITVAVISIGVSGSTPVVGTVIARAGSGASALVHSTGTLATREHVDTDMLHVLGNKWAIGLGFLHPAAHYVPGLPQGSIRDIDTGVFNVLMTMGIIGVLMIYAPLVYMMRELLRAARTPSQSVHRFPPWILYGSAAWIAWAAAGSPTLVLLFSTAGLVVTAVTLAVLAHLISEPELGLSG